MWLLGQSLLQGSGCDVDFDGAKKWLTEAAQQESYDALHWLGVMHEYGLGLERDTRKARALYETAASNGHAMAEYHLALMHAYGDRPGTPQDLPRALTLFQKGAARNHGGSCFNLGRMTMYGQGTPVDYDVARYWFSRAIAGVEIKFAR
jgi:TPR repeat protein